MSNVIESFYLYTMVIYRGVISSLCFWACSSQSKSTIPYRSSKSNDAKIFSEEHKIPKYINPKNGCYSNKNTPINLSIHSGFKTEHYANEPEECLISKGLVNSQSHIDSLKTMKPPIENTPCLENNSNITLINDASIFSTFKKRRRAVDDLDIDYRCLHQISNPCDFSEKHIAMKYSHMLKTVSNFKNISEYNDIIVKIANVGILSPVDFDEISKMSDLNIINIMKACKEISNQCSNNLKKMCNDIAFRENTIFNSLEDDELVELIEIYGMALEKCTKCILVLSITMRDEKIIKDTCTKSTIATEMGFNEQLIKIVNVYSEFVNNTLITIESLCNDHGIMERMTDTQEFVDNDTLSNFVQTYNLHIGRYRFAFEELDPESKNV